MKSSRRGTGVLEKISTDSGPLDHVYSRNSQSAVNFDFLGPSFSPSSSGTGPGSAGEEGRILAVTTFGWI